MLEIANFYASECEFWVKFRECSLRAPIAKPFVLVYNQRGARMLTVAVRLRMEVKRIGWRIGSERSHTSKVEAA